VRCRPRGEASPARSVGSLESHQPDGRYLVAMRGDSTGLSPFDVKTRKWEMLVPDIVAYPCWSHDGQYLYFQRLGDKSDVVRLAVPNGKLA
jgi:hypothetical protein